MFSAKPDPLCAQLTGLSRATTPALDLTSEDSIATAFAALQSYAPLQRILIVTGALTINGTGPEKKLSDVTPDHLMASFQINAIGPALLLKHITPLLPRQKRCVIGVLSARVGSIGDNHMGGWYSYRASKAALNMLIRTSAVELARKYQQLILTALQPGTVRTSLSAPYVCNHQQFTPEESASHLLRVMDGLTPLDHGGFRAWDGQKIEW